MALVEVQVPDIGDFKDVEIIELLVKPGDPVAVDQSLLTVESDKASMEIPSTHAGVVQEMKVRVGDKVSQGSAVLVLEAAAGAASAAAASSPLSAAEQPTALAAAPALTQAPVAAPPQPAAAAGSGAPIQVEVPDIGDFDEVAVIEVFVKPGDTVKVEQSLITVESDKASMEIPSSHAGVVDKVLVVIGDKVAKGSPVVLLKAGAGAVTSPSPQPAAAPAAVAAQPAAPAPRELALSTGAAPAAVPAHEPTAAQGQLPHASPSIRRLARELGVPLAEVSLVAGDVGERPVDRDNLPFAVREDHALARVLQRRDGAPERCLRLAAPGKLLHERAAGLGEGGSPLLDPLLERAIRVGELLHERELLEAVPHDPRHLLQHGEQRWEAARVAAVVSEEEHAARTVPDTAGQREDRGGFKPCGFE